MLGFSSSSLNGTLSTVTSSQQLDRYDSDYKSSPKGINIDGAIVISEQAVIFVTTTGVGGGPGGWPGGPGGGQGGGPGGY